MISGRQLSIYFKVSSIFESSDKSLNSPFSYTYTSAFTSLEAIPILLNTLTAKIFTESAFEILVSYTPIAPVIGFSLVRLIPLIKSSKDSISVNLSLKKCLQTVRCSK